MDLRLSFQVPNFNKHNASHSGESYWIAAPPQLEAKWLGDEWWLLGNQNLQLPIATHKLLTQSWISQSCWRPQNERFMTFHGCKSLTFPASGKKWGTEFLHFHVDIAMLKAFSTPSQSVASGGAVFTETTTLLAGSSGKHGKRLEARPSYTSDHLISELSIWVYEFINFHHVKCDVSCIIHQIHPKRANLCTCHGNIRSGTLLAFQKP